MRLHLCTLCLVAIAACLTAALGCGKADPAPLVKGPSNDVIQIPKGMPGTPEHKAPR